MEAEDSVPSPLSFLAICGDGGGGREILLPTPSIGDPASRSGQDPVYPSRPIHSRPPESAAGIVHKGQIHAEPVHPVLRYWPILSWPFVLPVEHPQICSPDIVQRDHVQRACIKIDQNQSCVVPRLGEGSPVRECLLGRRGVGDDMLAILGPIRHFPQID